MLDLMLDPRHQTHLQTPNVSIHHAATERPIVQVGDAELDMGRIEA